LPQSVRDGSPWSLIASASSVADTKTASDSSEAATTMSGVWSAGLVGNVPATIVVARGGTGTVMVVVARIGIVIVTAVMTTSAGEGWVGTPQEGGIGSAREVERRVRTARVINNHRSHQ
jgi:hypothetical protein